MKRLEHDNIIKFIDMFTCTHYVYIVQELMQCSLHQYITREGILSEETAAMVLKTVAKAVNYIHS